MIRFETAAAEVDVAAAADELVEPTTLKFIITE